MSNLSKIKVLNRASEDTHPLDMYRDCFLPQHPTVYYRYNLYKWSAMSVIKTEHTELA